MLPSSQAFLLNIKAALDREIAPVTSGEQRKLLASGIPLALNELLFRIDGAPDQLASVHAELLLLTERYNALAHAHPAKLNPIPVASAAALGSKFDDVSDAIDAVREPLVAQIPVLSALRDDLSVDGPLRDGATLLLVALAENEMKEVSRPAAAAAAAAQGDRLEMARDRLQDRMAAVFDAPDLQIVAIHRVSGGFSKETYIIDVTQGGGEKRYVLRAGVPGGGYLDAIYGGLDKEFPILQWAWSHGIPAPEPYHLETDESLIGSLFVLMQFKEGSAAGDSMYARDQVDVGIFPALAGILARLHALPWQGDVNLFPEVEGRTDLTIAESAQLFIEKNRRWQASADLRPSVALTIAFDWLERNVPPNDAPARFIHGDIGFHNMLVSGGDVVALLDWEGAAIGAPAWDLVAARLMLDDRVSWDQFLDWYVDAGGVRPTDAELDYYLMMRALAGNLTCLIALEKMFEQTGYVPYLELGLAARPFYLQKLIDSVCALWNEPA